MKVERTAIPDVLILEPKVFADDRGFFFESFNNRTFNEVVGGEYLFVQDNHSGSQQGILRGLHYQIHDAQDKLVRVTAGEVFDVAIDMRKQSPTCGQWVSARLSAKNRMQMWIPKGFAHGFYVLSEFAEVQYKTTAYYAPQHERTIIWNDRDIGIDWPFDGTPKLSARDGKGGSFDKAELFS